MLVRLRCGRLAYRTMRLLALVALVLALLQGGEAWAPRSGPGLRARSAASLLQGPVRLRGLSGRLAMSTSEIQQYVPVQNSRRRDIPAAHSSHTRHPWVGRARPVFKSRGRLMQSRLFVTKVTRRRAAWSPNSDDHEPRRFVTRLLLSDPTMARP